MGLHTIPDAKERVRACVRKQAFSTLGGSDTAAIQGDTLKNFVKLFDLDIDALLGEHDDGDGALELHEFKQLLTDKPSVDMLPGPSFQPAALVPVLSSPSMSSTQQVFALHVRCLLVSGIFMHALFTRIMPAKERNLLCSSCAAAALFSLLKAFLSFCHL